MACIRNDQIERKAQMASYCNVDNVLYRTKEVRISSHQKDIFITTSDDDEVNIRKCFGKFGCSQWYHDGDVTMVCPYKFCRLQLLDEYILQIYNPLFGDIDDNR